MNLAISAFLFVVLLSACNQQKQSADVPVTFEAKQLIAIMRAPQSISKEAIAEIVGTDANRINMFNEVFALDISKRTVLFSWQNGEKISVKTAAGKELSINEYSSIGIGFVAKISTENFQKKFESATAVQDEINRITKDESIDADVAIAEAKYLAEIAKTQQFEKLENVGELAYWETPINALHIFAKGISFTISTNLPNEKTSKEKAIELAQSIFNNL